MSADTWASEQADVLTGTTEIEIATARADGSLRSPRIIWIVRDGDRVFVRSTNGTQGAWYRGALTTGRARITAGSHTEDVRLVPREDEASLAACDRGYRAKYGTAYTAIVDHMTGPGPRSATFEVLPPTA